VSVRYDIRVVGDGHKAVETVDGANYVVIFTIDKDGVVKAPWIVRMFNEQMTCFAVKPKVVGVMGFKVVLFMNDKEPLDERSKEFWDDIKTVLLEDPKMPSYQEVKEINKFVNSGNLGRGL